MSLWKLRWVLFARWTRTVGWGMVIVAAAAVTGIALLFLAAQYYPWLTAAVAAFALLRLHGTRRDLHLIANLTPYVRLHVAQEYLLLAIPICTLLACSGAAIQAVVVAVFAASAAFLPQFRPVVYSGRALRIERFGYSPEWTAGIRRHAVLCILLVPCLALCAILPYTGFPALYLTTLFCQTLYADNEPLQLVLLPEISAGRFLARKIRTAQRNYFLAAAPFALLTAACHPQQAWLAALWLPASALMFVYFVTAKYACYDPASPAAPAGMATQLGIAGFLVPPLLPATLFLLVSNILRAEKNLNRYLYDYD